MKNGFGKYLLRSLLLLILPISTVANAAIDGVTGSTFNLTAKSGYISTGDGNTVLTWGYANEAGLMQYPGPTLIVNAGDTITINLANELPMPVSIVFPGQTGVVANGGDAGLITKEAPTGGSVSYTFTALQPGTYLYHSGTRPELQIEMGLVGALIVRPATPQQAYDHPASYYDHEYLFLLTEMDLRVHEQVELGQLASIDNTTYFSTFWFINGRNAPDTMSEAGAWWLPHQPYNSLPRMHPGEKLLLRIVGAGRDLHPFHHHGNHTTLIARDGRLLESAPGSGPDIAPQDFTVKVVPGGTYDAVFEWTGKGLGWDIYGHAPDDPVALHEYEPDHGKPLPVTLPNDNDLTFGGFWAGPYLGQFATLPPGEGGLNPNAGLAFMWHSHTEKELTNDDIFPGGMMTMLIIEPHGVPIP